MTHVTSYYDKVAISHLLGAISSLKNMTTDFTASMNLTSTLSCSLTIDGQVYTLNTGEILEYKFDTSGPITCNGKLHHRSGYTKVLTVNVVGAPDVEAPFMWSGRDREWSQNGILVGTN